MTTFATLPADISPPADTGDLPGEPETIRDLSRKFRSEAETLRSAAHELGNADTSSHWQGPAGHTCQATVNRAAARIDQLANAYDECAAALAQWAERLRGAQEDARRASNDIDEARERLQAAHEALERVATDDGVEWGGGPAVVQPAVQTMPSEIRAPGNDAQSLPAGIPAPDADGSREQWQQKADEAQADLEAARQRLDDAIATRDDAAAVAASKIQDAEPGRDVVAMGTDWS